MQLPNDEWIVVGVIVSPHGVKGEVKIKVETNFPDRLNPGNKVAFRKTKNKDVDWFTIKQSRLLKGYALVKFENINDRNVAETLRGVELLVSTSDKRELEPDNYYIKDVIGLEMHTDDGIFIGIVDDVLSYKANDVYVVGKILVPAVKEFILNIDLSTKRITVKNMQGLLSDSND